MHWVCDFNVWTQLVLKFRAETLVMEDILHQWVWMGSECPHPLLSAWVKLFRLMIIDLFCLYSLYRSICWHGRNILWEGFVENPRILTKKAELKTDRCRRQWGPVCRIFVLAEWPAYIGICVKLIGLWIDLGKLNKKINAPFLYNFLFETDFCNCKIPPHPQTSTWDYLMHSNSHSFLFKTDFAGCVPI